MSISHHEMEEIADRAAVKAIDGFFVKLGIDTSKPLEMQQDFAHLRWWRETMDTTKSRALMTLVSLFVTGVAAAVWTFFRKA